MTTRPTEARQTWDAVSAYARAVRETCNAQADRDLAIASGIAPLDASPSRDDLRELRAAEHAALDAVAERVFQSLGVQN